MSTRPSPRLVRRLLLLLPALVAMPLLAPQPLTAQDGPVFELSDVTSAAQP